MKKVLFINILLMLCVGVFAKSGSQAMKVLNKATAIVGRVSGKKTGKQSGTIAIKGNMFMARTNKAMVWFNGKTQWSYLKMTNEVNISTPNEAKRMSMNPYTFMSMYKNGYNLSMTTSGSNYVVHMTAQNKKRRNSHCF